ncbi:hypothetical protein ma116 [Moumouvirus australiensis]|uniref:Uncharacterized protein n=1 Tax=Moumouvirus australiensis TaxID=2109587 RepID=A0A2P1EKT2_9VIRU|nr:hypothetical protein QKC55_gp788 [Moumouvirus australiensis]AVL94502.1 hypothetical protein ma116 [Moumouvirus australiensis]
MSFDKIQFEFISECNISREVPDIKSWSKKIRNVFPKGAIYIIVHRYIDVSGSELDAFILQSTDIKWPSQKNDSVFRNQYFHKSSHDSNIWILKNEYRTETPIIKSLIMNYKKFITI